MFTNDSRENKHNYGTASQYEYVPEELHQSRGDKKYRYQAGFGNTFSSEAIPGVILNGRNLPQKVNYDLYPEQLNGTSFISPRSSLQHVWLYRILPSSAHGNFTELNKDEGDIHIEACFSSTNDNVKFVAEPMCWKPIRLGENERRDFVQGIKTFLGHGDSTTKEGVAVHVYNANVSMGKRAFCNNDGDMLILPQQGSLDIQTELGKMMVKPGELAVIQAGIRFKISLPEAGEARGYIQEIFGSHYELPELGPLGSNGLAMPRDFEMPVAHFDVDVDRNNPDSWEIVYKLAGQLWSCKQNHTPFDVVAWHGNYVPYKYDTANFVPSGVVDRDQSDPSIFTVLTAKSKISGVSISDVIIFVPRWSSITDSFRPPYYHRNMATEVMGIIKGEYPGKSKPLEAGGLSLQSSYMPHGETYETFRKELDDKGRTQPTRTGDKDGVEYLPFMFHISTYCAVTRWAHKHRARVGMDLNEMWKSMEAPFLDKLGTIEKALREHRQKTTEEFERWPFCGLTGK